MQRAEDDKSRFDDRAKCRGNPECRGGDRALWIVGASGRAAAQSAIRAGYQVCVFDAFADFDTSQFCPTVRVSPFPAAIRQLINQACQSNSSPIILLTGGMENHLSLWEFLADRFFVAGPLPNSVRAVRNPWQLAETVRASGAETLDMLPDTTPPAHGVYVWKPFRSGGGRRIRLHDPRRGCLALPRRPGRGYYQGFVVGRPYAAVFIGNGREAALVGVTRQWCGVRGWGAPRFAYCGSITLDHWPCDGQWLAELGACLVRDYRLVGLFGVDFICRRGRPFVLEVNPRYTASCEVLELALGRSLVDLHVRACLHGELPCPPKKALAIGQHAGKAILYARRPMTFSLPAERLRHVAELSHHAYVADIPQPGTTISRRSPMLTVCVTGPVRQEVRHRVSAVVLAIQHQLVQGTHTRDVPL